MYLFVPCVFRSHGTYYFIAAGCHWSLGRYDEAQKLLDAVIGLLDKKKIGGKDLPTEVFIKKKREFLSLIYPFLTISVYMGSWLMTLWVVGCCVRECSGVL